jgi:hypothetical protein
VEGLEEKSAQGVEAVLGWQVAQVCHRSSSRFGRRGSVAGDAAHPVEQRLSLLALGLIRGDRVCVEGAARTRHEKVGQILGNLDSL